MADERDPTERMRDPNISRRYLELGAQEPPRALDEAILAASRRAVGARPAPLVAPTGRRRWYFPLAAAAVIMLAVAVTLQIERQKPDDEVVASALPRSRTEARKAPAGPEQPRPAPKPRRAPAQFAAEPPPAAAPPGADAARDLAKSNERASAGQGVRALEAPAEARARSDAMQRPQASVMGAVAERKVEAPEPWLQRIAELRRQGKHEEADKALAEFRKRYPDYRLTDEVRAKVERTK